MSARGVNLRSWPGRGKAAEATAERRSRPADRFGEHGGLVLVAAAERGRLPETWGLGVALSVVGRSLRQVQLVVPDGLDRVPKRRLQRWAARQALAGASAARVRVVTRQKFCHPDHGLLARRGYTGGGWLVTADEGRSLGLLAERWAPGRGRFTGGFSLGLPGWGAYGEWRDKAGRRHTGWRPLLHRPALRLKAIGGHGLMAEWGRCGRGGRTAEGAPAGHWERGRPFLGRIVDLIGAAHGLDGLDTSELVEHLAAFGLPALDAAAAVTIDPAGADELLAVARALHRLALVLDDEASLWLSPVEDRREGRAYVGLRGLKSPGSIATAVLRRSGLTPPLAKFKQPDDEALDRWVQAAHGGWCTSDVRGQVLPCIDADVRSAYPAAWSLSGWWQVLCARQLRDTDVLGSVQSLAEQAAAGDLSALFERWPWPTLGRSLCKVRLGAEASGPFPIELPDETGSHLELGLVSAVQGRSWWCTGADVVAAALLSGRMPELVSAIRLDPDDSGGFERSRPLPLLPGVVVPPGGDPVPWLIRRRQRAKDEGDLRTKDDLRAVANAGAWGAFARLDQHRSGGRLVETPHTWSWPPVAAGVPACSRLWLAMLERQVRDRGGATIARDTDGAAVLSSPSGAAVELPGGRTARALAWSEVDALLAPFDSLDPFDDGRPFWTTERGSEEQPLHIVSLGPKRYVKVLPTGAGGFEAAGGTEASLGGTVVEPPGWTGRDADRRHVWTLPVGQHSADRAAGSTAAFRAPWDDPGAVPFPQLRRFSVGSPRVLGDLPEALGCHPFSPLLEASPDHGLSPITSAPLTLDPGTDLADWRDLAWLDEEGRSVDVGAGQLARGGVPLRTVADLGQWWAKPVPHSACGSVELDERLVRRVGRGGALIDAALADPGARADGHQALYDPGDPAGYVAELAREAGPAAFAARGGVSLDAAKDMSSGRGSPGATTVRRVLGSRGTVRVCALDDCDQALGAGQRRYCSITCREGARNARRRQPVESRPPLCAMTGCDLPARPGSATCSGRHKVALQRLRAEQEVFNRRPYADAEELASWQARPADRMWRDKAPDLDDAWLEQVAR
ncbi:MAG: hypothetical protein ACRD0B_00415 [Acidimicrobiales bacterium]